MKKIVVVGAGLNGSLLADSMIAHSISTDHWTEVVFVDHDSVERRNSPGNLNVIANAGTNKAVVLASKFIRNGLADAKPIQQKLTEKNCAQILGGASLLVGAVDNIDARNIMFNAAVNLDVPYMDMGISWSGFHIGWLAGEFDTMQYKPWNKDRLPVSEKEPACVLIGSRIHAAMAAECAAKSIMLFLDGHDPSGYVYGLTDTEPSSGDMLGWSCASSVMESSIKPIYVGRLEHGHKSD